MKKTITVLLTILILVFILGYIFDRGGDYVRERELWQIQNDSKQLAEHPDSIPENSFNKIISRYDKFAEHYSESKLAPKARLLIGELYISNKSYPKAHNIFNNIIQKYSYNEEIVAQAQLGIARAYEKDNDWANASKIYELVTTDYPLTIAGFSVPAYLGYYYLSQDLPEKAGQAFEEAVMFYQNIANSYPNSPLENNALRMTIECQINQKNWKDALITARSLIFKYPSSSMLFQAINTVNDVCVNQLKEYDCAIDMYQQFIIVNPEHPINPVLQKIIENLNKLKTKLS